MYIIHRIIADLRLSSMHHELLADGSKHLLDAFVGAVIYTCTRALRRLRIRLERGG